MAGWQQMETKDQEKEVTEEKGRESEELGAQLFHILVELEEAREVSLRYQEDYQELQGESPHSRLQLGRLLNHFLAPRQQLMKVLISGQLEEERFVSAEQAETFSRQIQSLKGSSCLRQPPEAPQSVLWVCEGRPCVQISCAASRSRNRACRSRGSWSCARLRRRCCCCSGQPRRLQKRGRTTSPPCRRSCVGSAAAPPPDPAGGPPGGHRAEGPDRPQEPEPGPEPW